jgi:glyoxylate reductase
MADKPRILVTRTLPEPAAQKLSACGDVHSWTSKDHMPKAEIVRCLPDKQAIICLLTETIDEEVLSAGRELKIVANIAVGYNNIDVAVATRRRIAVTNTPRVLDETTADLAFALLLAIARRLGEAERFLRAGLFKGWDLDLMLGVDVYQKTLGVVGFGRIGRAVARRAQGFSMPVLYTDGSRAPEEVERALHATRVNLETLLREADFVSLHVPLLPGTRHLIGKRQLDLMKPTACLVNNSRGPVVDEAALAEALAAGKIRGAALDVFENEPEVHPKLLKLENVVLVPHIGSASVETRLKMAMIAVENVVEALHGRKPPNIVNPEILG